MRYSAISARSRGVVLTATYLAASLFAAVTEIAAAPDLEQSLKVEIEPRIEIDHRGVRVMGLAEADLQAVAAREIPSERWRDILHVVAVDEQRLGQKSTPEDLGRERPAAWSALPALLGRYDIDLVPEAAGALRFRPRFAPAPGLILSARFDGVAWDRLRGEISGSIEAGSRKAGSVEAETLDAVAHFLVPEPAPRSLTRVSAVTPSGKVPENLLRLYVHFSEPMSARHVLEHIRLLGPNGEPVPVAFVDVPGGLWDPERRRLTLFVHPGRVKRGVGPNQALGPVLESGGRYTLRIEASARDVHGRPLAEAFEAIFEVGPADHSSPDPTRFRIQAPADPAAPLRLELDEPADRALLSRLLSIEKDGEPVEALFEVDAEGRRVTVRPASPWRAGVYRLLVPRALEDSAGNRVDRLFEEAPAEDAENEGPPVVIPFDIAFFT